ncbi:MAG: nitrogen regulation protein NR(II), partial [Candidatus Freyarchaeota archaeon]
ILASSPDAITVTDLDGNLIECNQAALDLHGFSSKEEVIGQSAFKYISEKDRERAKRNMIKTLIQGSLSNVEYTLLTRDGREFPAELSASVLRDASGNPIGFVAIIKDITERKMMEEALLRSERLATIGEVAMMVGHDLRNPLTGIAGAVYYLKRKLASSMDEKTAEMFELIERDIQYSNKIVEDLLEYSREIQLELAETDINSVVDEALSLVSVPPNIRVSKVVVDDPVVMVDVEKMKRVFVNIVKNSFDAMPEGGELAIEIRLAGGNLKIIFADTGRGVPPELLDKIWAPLFTTKARGLGMGLPICKRLVEAHGGSILLESLPGKGTTITITLPVKRKVEEGEKV